MEPVSLKVDLFASEAIEVNGEPLSLRGKKARVILAMLITAKDFRRPRSWLISKLWSDRAPEQAYMSLRQALSEIRRALGEYKSVLQADHQHVWLLADQLQSDYLCAIQSQNIQTDYHEILPSIQLQDVPYKLWKSALERAISGASTPVYQNSTRATHPQEKGGVTLLLCAQNPSSLLERTYLQRVAGQVLDQIGGQSFYEIDKALGTGEITLEIGTFDFGYGPCLELLATETQSGQVLSQYSVPVDTAVQTQMQIGRVPEGMLAHLDTFASDVIASLSTLKTAKQPQQEAYRLYFEAVRLIFTFRKPDQEIAERYLMQAYDLAASPGCHAWMAFAKAVEVLEHFANEQAILEAAKFHARKCVELAPKSVFSLSIASLVLSLLDIDFDEAADLANEAIQRAPFSPLAHQAVATAYLSKGDVCKCVQHSTMTIKLSGHSPLKPFWHLHNGLANLAAGNYRQALASAKISARYAPNLRGTQRLLFGLHLLNQNSAGARSAFHMLKYLEPNFSLDRLVNDEQYPITTLRSVTQLDRVEIQNVLRF